MTEMRPPRHIPGYGQEPAALQIPPVTIKQKPSEWRPPLSDTAAQEEHDPVAAPSHYRAKGGIEVLDLIQHEPFGRASAIKYIFRAGKKNPARELEDLRKARFLIDREIQQLEKEQKS